EPSAPSSRVFVIRSEPRVVVLYCFVLHQKEPVMHRHLIDAHPVQCRQPNGCHVINDHAASGRSSIHVRLDDDGSSVGSKQSVATNSASCSPPDAVISSSIAVRRHLESGASTRPGLLDSGF